MTLTKALPRGWSASATASTTVGAELYDNFQAVTGSGRSMGVGGLIWVLGVNKAL